MKTVHAIAAAALLATVAVVGAVSAEAPNSRPPGVSPGEWAPISDTLGVVLDQPLPGAADLAAPGQPDTAGQTQRPGRAANDRVGGGSLGGAILIPPISGYLMVRRGNQWQRVILVEPVKGPGVAG